jgi:hypothetical protein
MKRHRMLPLYEESFLEGTSRRIQQRRKTRMLNESKRERFACLTSFSHLNGREKQNIIVGDKPEARIAKFLYCTRINYDKKSQRNTRHPAGYLELENGKKFDLAKQTAYSDESGQ